MTSYARRIAIRLLAALAFAVPLALGYLGVRDAPPAPAATVEKLRLALPDTAGASLLHVAAARGYFAEEALDVTIIPASHGKAAIERLLQDKADLATAAEVPFVLQVLAGQPLGIAASVLSAPNDNMVVARRDRGIASPRDLTKKKIGVTFRTSGEYFLWAFLIRHRLPPDSVALMDVPPDRMVRALADGTIDAAATWQPIVLDAQSALGGNAVSLAETNAYTELHVVVGRSEFLEGHPEAIEKFVRALLKAEQFIRSRPGEALNLVAGRLKIDVHALGSIWQGFSFRVDLLQSQLITLEEEARWAMARGYATKGPVPNFLPHLYLDALLAVRPERVTVVR